MPYFFTADRLQSLESILTDITGQIKDLKAENESRARENRLLAQESKRQAQESERKIQESERKIQELKKENRQQAQDGERKLQELKKENRQQAQDSEQQIQELKKETERRIRESRQESIRQAQESERQVQELKEELEKKDEDMQQQHNALKKEISQLQSRHSQDVESLKEVSVRRVGLTFWLTFICQYTVLLTPLHLRVLLDDARKKVLTVLENDSWEELRGSRNLDDQVDFIFRQLSIQCGRSPLTPSCVRFLCSYNNIRRLGNLAAHRATKDNIRRAIFTQTIDQNRSWLEMLFNFTFDESIGNDLV